MLLLLLLSSLVTGPFFLVLLLNQRWSPPFRLQVSDCSTFRIMCDDAGIAVFLSASIECFPGTAYKYFFFKPFVTIPVAQVTAGIILRFRFHVHFISTVSFSFFIFNYYIWPICRNFCVSLDSITLLLLLLLLTWTLADSKQQNLSWDYSVSDLNNFQRFMNP
jgi:hypothetical protein